MAAALDEEQIKNITRQVEFYFSDSNLPRDKFLRTTVEQSDDGLVSLGLICSFTRMRLQLGLEAVKPEDVPEETVLAVAEVLRKSSFLRVSEDGKRIGRSSELLKPEEVIEQIDSRTVAASPLPYDVKIEDVQAFFGGKGKVNSVRLPRHISDRRAFCGTALIEFANEEDAKKVLQENLVYAGVELELKPKNDFDAEREKSSEDVERNHSKKDNSKESYPKGLIVAFELKPLAIVQSEKQNDSEIVKDEAKVNDADAPNSSKSEEATENIDNVKVGAEINDTDAPKSSNGEEAQENIDIVKDGAEVNDTDAPKSSKTEEAAENIDGMKIEEAAEHIDGVKDGDEANDTDAPKSRENNETVETIDSVKDEAVENIDCVKDGEAATDMDMLTSNNSEEATESIDYEEKSSEDVVEEEGKGSAQGDDSVNEKAVGDSSLKDETLADKVFPADDGNKPANESSGSFNDKGVVTREDLKVVFRKFGVVKFIDYRMGEESGYVRFEEADAAVKARAMSVLAEEGGLIVKEKYIATLEALTGEAERDYWSMLRGNKDKNKDNRGYRGRGKHNRGGRHFHGKRSRDVDAAKAWPNKAQKVSK